MPEELDPREQTIYDDWERKRKDYADFAATAPVRENPGLWRKLAAIGIGAFGGSQYDKGGLQWGQQMGNEVLEGPYQRRMNEHLKMLAAKRQGLDVAQEGMGVVGQIAARKAQAAAAAQAAADRKTAAENALYQKSQYAQGKYEQDLAKNTTGNYKVFTNRDEALKTQQSDPAYQKWELREDPVEVPGVGRRYYLAEPDSERQNRKALDVSATINMYNQIAPKVGMDPIADPGRVSKEQADVMLKQATALYGMNAQSNRDAAAMSRTMAMLNSRGGDDEGKAAKADEKRKYAETAKINAQFASLKASKENQYMDQIARARSNGNEAEAQRLEKQRGLELVEALNNAALQTANIWGHEQFKQYRMGPKGVEEFMVGKGTEAPKTAAPVPTNKTVDPLGVL